MKVDLFLQYYDYNDENFDVDDNYYKDESDYIKALENEYNSTKDSVFEAISGKGFGNPNTYKFRFANEIKKEEKLSLTKCESSFLNEDETEMTINDLMRFKNNSFFPVFIKFNLDDNTEEKFEGELKMWASTTNNVLMLDYDDDWKYLNKPTRDIKFELNENGHKISGVLQKCRIEEIIDYNIYFITSESIIFD